MRRSALKLGYRTQMSGKAIAGANAARWGLRVIPSPIRGENLNIGVPPHTGVAGLFDAGAGDRDLPASRGNLRKPGARRKRRNRERPKTYH
jgi:hypothetical protein